LLIGLNLALDRNIRCLKVIGDSDLIVSQVNLKFAMKNERLRRYRDSVRDTMKLFDDFSIEAVPREENYVVDALVVSASTLQPCEGSFKTCAKWKWSLDHQSLIT
jgi:ribonuclease HI